MRSRSALPVKHVFIYYKLLNVFFNVNMCSCRFNIHYSMSCLICALVADKALSKVGQILSIVYYDIYFILISFFLRQRKLLVLSYYTEY